MISHPVIMLIAVATTDVDPVACMQELASVHHTPSCLQSGQYDNETVQRVYFLVHDVNNVRKNEIDSNKEFAKMQSYFPASHTKYLALNSLPLDRPYAPQVYYISIF
jgi:hypothetical protein